MNSQVLDSRISFIETDDASIVPFSPGQLIIEDTGKTFYDPSFGTKVSDRRLLNPRSAARTACVTIGNVNNYTESEVDFLCTSDTFVDALLNAINKLPSGGGEVVILDGSYNLSANKTFPSKNYISIRGNGDSTVINITSSSINSPNPLTLSSMKFIIETTFNPSSNKNLILDNVTMESKTSTVATVSAQTLNGYVVIQDGKYAVNLEVTGDNDRINGVTFASGSLKTTGNYCMIHNNMFDAATLTIEGANGSIGNNIVKTKIAVATSGQNNFIYANKCNNSIENNGTNNILNMNVINNKSDYVSYSEE